MRVLREGKQLGIILSKGELRLLTLGSQVMYYVNLFTGEPEIRIKVEDKENEPEATHNRVKKEKGK